MNQELPFTPAIADYVSTQAARSQALVGDNPSRFVLIVFGIASIAPVVFSLVFLPQGVRYRPAVVAIWVIAWVGGGAVAYLKLSDAAQGRRDLAGGVFVRWTRPFTVGVVGSRRAGSSARVRVGDRDLKTEADRNLYSIGSRIGEVHYLPVTGRLLELRDESGNLLWSRVSGRSEGG